MSLPATNLTPAIRRCKLRTAQQSFGCLQWAARSAGTTHCRQWHSGNAPRSSEHRVRLPAAHNGPRRWRPQSFPWLTRSVVTAKSANNVHAPKSAPLQAQMLYDALSNLEQTAAPFLDTSRIKSVKVSLEQSGGPTRLAIIGIEHTELARRLARILLADPLSQEEDWEYELLDGEFEQDPDLKDANVLLKHGSQSLIDGDTHPALCTYTFPGRSLQKNGIEIIICRSPKRGYTDPDYVEKLLNLTFPGGGEREETYPVLKTMIAESNVHEMVYTEKVRESESKALIKGIVDGDWHAEQVAMTPPSKVTAVFVNVSKAEDALDTIRTSMSNSSSFQHDWLDSGVQAVRDWMLSGTVAQSPEYIKPIMLPAVENIIATTSASILEAEKQATIQAKRASLPDATRKELASKVDAWCQSAHAEYQKSFKAAFKSEEWKRMRWYSLLLNVDDVTDCVQSLVMKCWFPESMESLGFLCGRLAQAGLIRPPRKEKAQEQDPGYVDLAVIPSTGQVNKPDPLSLFIKDQLEYERNHAFNTCDQMQGVAEFLVKRTWRSILLSNGLCAFLYFALPNATLFETGAVAAFFSVLALGRLQSKWGKARKSWRKRIEGAGIDKLRSIQEQLEEAVAPGAGQVGVNKGDVEKVRRAKEALRQVEVEVEKVKMGRVRK